MLNAWISKLILVSIVSFLIGHIDVKLAFNVTDSSMYSRIDPTDLFYRFRDKFSNLNHLLSNNQSHSTLESFSQSNASNASDLNFDINQAAPILMQPHHQSPVSFTVLMNFKNNGKTSLQLIDDQSNTIYWSDMGVCEHGQILDPAVGVCRDIFCTDGYIFTTNGCIRANSSSMEPTNSSSSTIQQNLHVELRFVYRTNTSFRFDNSKQLLEQVKTNLTKLFGITSKRILNFKLDENLSNKTKNMARVDDENRSSLIVSFTLKEIANDTEENMEPHSTLIVYYLSLLAVDKLPLVIDSELLLVDVKHHELDDNEWNVGWCSHEQGHRLLNISTFRVFVTFDSSSTTSGSSMPKYFVYANETDTLYSSGYFYLKLVYSPINSNTTSPKTIGHPNSNSIHLSEWHYQGQIIDSNPFSTSHLILIDVTDQMIENDSKIITKKTLIVCNRAPKLIEQCMDHETIRLRTCELDIQPNRSYCSYALGKCFSLDEYELDLLKPNEFIRVCKYLNESDKSQFIEQQQQQQSLADQIEMLRVIPGWISVISLILSLVAMLATLVTYLLFAELRNIPGWNMINLTLALFLAHASFLIGSLVGRQVHVLCFLISLSTHYGFLAAFFWMNVIAFDLFHNFRQKASHVLLKSVTVRDRLPIYALYAWLTPLLIVVACLSVDLATSVSYMQAPVRPCYAGYLTGCSENLDHESLYEKNQTGIANDYLERCYSSQSIKLTYASLMQNCYIENGTANLLFFGVPVGIIIVLNAVLFVLSIRNIRRAKRQQKCTKHTLRRFTRTKMLIDQDFKFYIQMSVIMGFTWTTGFFISWLSGINENRKFHEELIYQLMSYAFILSNASIGLFIFFAFTFKRSTLDKYKHLLWNKYRSRTAYKHQNSNTSKTKALSVSSHSSHESSESNRTTDIFISAASRSASSNSSAFY